MVVPWLVYLRPCRSMAVSNNKALEQARINSGMAHYDRGIARANFFPNISASGTYLYNTLDVSLIDSDKSAALQNAGNTIQKSIAGKMETLTQTIMTNPALAMEYMQIIHSIPPMFYYLIYYIIF